MTKWQNMYETANENDVEELINKWIKRNVFFVPNFY